MNGSLSEEHVRAWVQKQLKQKNELILTNCAKGVQLIQHLFSDAPYLTRTNQDQSWLVLVAVPREKVVSLLQNAMGLSEAYCEETLVGARPLWIGFDEALGKQQVDWFRRTYMKTENDYYACYD